MGKEVYFHFLSLKWAGSQPETSTAWKTACMQLSSCGLVSHTRRGPEVHLAPLLRSCHLCCMSLSHPWAHSAEVRASFSPPGNCHEVFVRVFHLKPKCAKVLQRVNFSNGSVSVLLSSILQIAGMNHRPICFPDILGLGGGPPFLIAFSNTSLHLFICLYSLHLLIPVLPWLCAGLQPGAVVGQESGLAIIFCTRQLYVVELLQG